MSANKQIQEYLAKAKEAEEQAVRTTDHHMKQSWQRIAASYREMAQRRLDGFAGRPSSSQPSPVPAAKAEPQEKDKS